MARYGKKAQETVEEAMKKFKKGKLKSGKSGKEVMSKKQAIAIGLSEARAKGAKVPKVPKKQKQFAEDPLDKTKGYFFGKSLYREKKDDHTSASVRLY